MPVFYSNRVVCHSISFALTWGRVIWVGPEEGVPYVRVAMDIIREKRNRRGWGSLPRSGSRCIYQEES